MRFVTARNARIRVRGQVLSATLHYGEEWTRLVEESNLAVATKSEMLSGLPDNTIRFNNNPLTFGLSISGRLLSFFPDFSMNTIDPFHISSGSDVVFLLCGSEVNHQWDFRQGEGRRKGVPYAYGLVLKCVDDRLQKYERIGHVGECYQGTKSYFLHLDEIKKTSRESIVLI
jgi:hypothetical protein